jgi:mannan endo-1,4-beta-mannosidase
MEAIRKATAERTGGKPGAEPVAPGATAEAKALLTRLMAAPSQGVLSGQENDPLSSVSANTAVIEATGRRPAIYGAELTIADHAGADARTALVAHVLRAHANGAEVSLSWRPARPTGDAPNSARGNLTDYEWNELLTPGSDLNKRWCMQVDEVAATLRALQDAGIAVLWNPYPEANGKENWWAGRKGIRGSAELYRQLFGRMTNESGLHNLVWVWESAAPESSSGSDQGMLSDYFPGLLFVDAVEARMDRPDERTGRGLAEISVGKPLGVELGGELPSPEALIAKPGWAWFLAAPPASAGAAARAEALRKLYLSPHVVSLAPAK